MIYYEITFEWLNNKLNEIGKLPNNNDEDSGYIEGQLDFITDIQELSYKIREDD